MAATIVVGLLLSVLGISVVGLLAFAEVAFAGPPTGRGAVAICWKPPLARGQELLTWATCRAREATAESLATWRGRQTVSRLVQTIQDGVATALASSPTTAPQPEPGCPSRPSTRIGVTPPEAIAIVDSLRATRTPAELQRIRQVAQKNAELTAQLSADQFEAAHVVCPLLADGAACAAFDSRPVTCRGWCHHVTDEGERCLLTDPEAEASRPMSAIDERALAVSRGAVEGLSRGILAAGLDGRLYELNSALATALATPDAAQRWVDREPVFAECTRADG